MKQSNLENQTQFSVEEPFFEEPELIPGQKGMEKPHVPLLKRRKTILAILILTICASLGILFGYAQYVEWQKKLREPVPVVVPTPMQMTPSELSSEVQSLRLELKQADPVRQELLFPQIDLFLRMEEKPR